MRDKKCFHCGEIIKDDYKIIAFDIPYVNLFFHVGCYHLIGDWGIYFTEKHEMLYNYIEKSEKRRRNG